MSIVEQTPVVESEEQNQVLEITTNETSNVQNDDTWHSVNNEIKTLENTLNGLKRKLKEIENENFSYSMKKLASSFYNEVVKNNGFLIHPIPFSGIKEFHNLPNLKQYGYPLICSDDFKHHLKNDNKSNLSKLNVFFITSIKLPENSLEEKLYPHVVEYLKDHLPIQLVFSTNISGYHTTRLESKKTFENFPVKYDSKFYVTNSEIKDTIYFTQENMQDYFGREHPIIKPINNAKVNIYYIEDLLK